MSSSRFAFTLAFLVLFAGIVTLRADDQSEKSSEEERNFEAVLADLLGEHPKLSKLCLGQGLWECGHLIEKAVQSKDNKEVEACVLEHASKKEGLCKDFKLDDDKDD